MKVFDGGAMKIEFFSLALNEVKSRLFEGAEPNMVPIKDVMKVVRRKAQLERKLNLWQRATNKVSPEHILHVKFIGEDGIDTGALAKEFLTETISDITNKFFPDGSPSHSSNDIQSGNFRACGKSVAASLSLQARWTTSMLSRWQSVQNIRHR
ncbi:HEG-like 1 [Paramuricea clavata]|uniref:HEG-like 1 n=1 Tax=Paramuricea clavata TaxID=317549 RepID=A0A6S7HBD8_PARCT|nr:HEG-like 1 [Paramuricea clavata]